MISSICFFFSLRSIVWLVAALYYIKYHTDFSPASTNSVTAMAIKKERKKRSHQWRFMLYIPTLFWRFEYDYLLVVSPGAWWGSGGGFTSQHCFEDMNMIICLLSPWWWGGGVGVRFLFFCLSFFLFFFHSCWFVCVVCFQPDEPVFCNVCMVTILLKGINSCLAGFSEHFPCFPFVRSFFLSLFLSCSPPPTPPFYIFFVLLSGRLVDGVCSQPGESVYCAVSLLSSLRELTLAVLVFQNFCPAHFSCFENMNSAKLHNESHTDGYNNGVNLEYGDK